MAVFHGFILGLFQCQNHNTNSYCLLLAYKNNPGHFGDAFFILDTQSVNSVFGGAL